jgi:cell division protein FtsN
MIINNKVLLSLCCVVLLSLAGCSRQQSDWEKTRAANTTEAYESFLKKYPSGEFTAQAQARVKELYEEHDWQKARDVDTVEAYQSFLKQYPEGKWTEEARIRVENFSLAQAPSGSATPAQPAPGSANAPTPGIPLTGDTSEPAAAPPPPTAAAPAPAPAPVTTPKKSAPAGAAPSAAASGTYGIQLGAFKSGSSAATRRWAHLQKKYPKLLAGLSPKVTSKKTSDGTLYRLQSFGITEAHARAICKTLKADSQACILVHPA